VAWGGQELRERSCAGAVLRRARASGAMVMDPSPIRSATSAACGPKAGTPMGTGGPGASGHAPPRMRSLSAATATATAVAAEPEAAVQLYGACGRRLGDRGRVYPGYIRMRGQATAVCTASETTCESASITDRTKRLCPWLSFGSSASDWPWRAPGNIRSTPGVRARRPRWRSAVAHGRAAVGR